MKREPISEESNAERTARLISAQFDRLSPVPMYHQISTILISAIKSGDLAAQDVLGGETDIADILNVSRPTIRHAISILVERGMVVRRRGSGSVVLGLGVRRSLGMTSLQQDLDKMGRSPHTKVLALERIEADPALADTMSIPLKSAVTHVRRLRLVDDTPIAIMENFLPGAGAGITVPALQAGSLYRLMSDSGLVPHVATQIVGARLATASEARLLASDAPLVLLTERRTSFDNYGRIVELARHLFVADLYTFEMNVVENHTTRS